MLAISFWIRHFLLTKSVKILIIWFKSDSQMLFISITELIWAINIKLQSLRVEAFYQITHCCWIKQKKRNNWAWHVSISKWASRYIKKRSRLESDIDWDEKLRNPCNKLKFLTTCSFTLKNSTIKSPLNWLKKLWRENQPKRSYLCEY